MIQNKSPGRRGVPSALAFFEAALSLFAFFFQAEDGIRDSSVTGVQTCALPIWVRDAGFGNRVGLELVPLDQIGGFAGFYLVSRTPAAGHCTSVDQRSPPGHALSRILTPTTNPSRTGMIVATRRGSWAAS